MTATIHTRIGVLEVLSDLFLGSRCRILAKTSRITTCLSHPSSVGSGKALERDAHSGHWESTRDTTTPDPSSPDTTLLKIHGWTVRGPDYAEVLSSICEEGIGTAE